MKDDKDLVVNGELIPDNLRYTSAYRETNYGDGHTLHAVTRDQKAALLICHILSTSDYGSATKANKAKMLEAAVAQLIIGCGYESVKTANVSYSPFYCSEEEGSTYLDDILESGNIEEGIANHVRDVVLNEDKIIIDAENPT